MSSTSQAGSRSGATDTQPGTAPRADAADGRDRGRPAAAYNGDCHCGRPLILCVGCRTSRCTDCDPYRSDDCAFDL